MKKILSLTKVYINSVYGISGAIEKLRADKKGVAKAIGIGLLILYGVGAMGAIFVMLNLSAYDAMEAGTKAIAAAGGTLRLQDSLLLTGVTVSVMLGLLFGFITTISTYFISQTEGNLLAMPLKPRELFVPKFIMTLVSEFLISGAYFLVAVVVRAVRENPPFIYYVWGLLSFLALPLIPLALTYFLIVPAVRAFSFMRRKDNLMYIGTAIGVVAMVAFQVGYQSLTANFANPQVILSMMTNPDSFITKFGAAYPPAILATRALADPAAPGAILNVLGLLGTSVAVVALMVLVLSGPYARSLAGFGEIRLKKLASSGEYIDRTARRRSTFSSLLAREVRLMNREPVYLMNGPVLILIMPLVFGISIAAQGSARGFDIVALGALPQVRELGVLIAAGIAALLGGMACATSTAVSRDGKAFSYLRSLPLDPRKYADAKLLHSMAISTVGCAVGVGIAAFVMKLGPAEVALALGIGLGFCLVLSIFGLMLDFARPKLNWENPMAAMKQNMNYTFTALGTMGFAGAFAAVAVFLVPAIGALYTALALLGFFSLTSALAFRRYRSYTARRFYEIEA